MQTEQINDAVNHKKKNKTKQNKTKQTNKQKKHLKFNGELDEIINVSWQVGNVIMEPSSLKMSETDLDVWAKYQCNRQFICRGMNRLISLEDSRLGHEYRENMIASLLLKSNEWTTHNWSIQFSKELVKSVLKIPKPNFECQTVDCETFATKHDWNAI